MKRGGGKSKGSGFERETCKKLSLWISKGEREDLLWRSAMSGGRATVQRKKGILNQTQCGDISAVHDWGQVLTGPFYVECKFYRSLNLESLLRMSNVGIRKFWKEATDGAKAHSKMPMLVCKENNWTIHLGLDSDGVGYLDLHDCVTAYYPGDDIYLVPFADAVERGRLPPPPTKPPRKRPSLS